MSARTGANQDAELENEIEGRRRQAVGHGEGGADGPVAERRLHRPVPTAEVLCDPLRLDGTLEF